MDCLHQVNASWFSLHIKITMSDILRYDCVG